MSGHYAADVTLASSDDIIIKSTNGTSDPLLKRNGDYVLGLVADNYVRVYHKRDDGRHCARPPMNTVTVEAAILSLAHSFIVDNCDCGDPQGKLNITGAIAQYYRGSSGTSAATTLAHGYQQELLVRRPAALPHARRTSSTRSRRIVGGAADQRAGSARDRAG